MDPTLINALADLGFAGGLILILVGGYRGWWIFGPIHKTILADLTADRNFWRNLALGTLRLAERAADKVDAAEADQRD